MRNIGIADFAPVAVEFGEMEFVYGPTVGVGNGVPGPLRKGTERSGFFEGFGKGLQAGAIGGEGELAVADGEWILGIELVEDGVVAGDEGMAIDVGGP